MPLISIKFISSFILLFGGLNHFILASDPDSQASASDFVWKVLNVLILIGIIYWFAKKPISSALRNSAGIAKKQLEDARETEERAIAQMELMREKFSDMEKETKEMVIRAREEAKSEKKIIVDAAKKEIQRMREHARFTIEQEYRKAEHELREWAAKESVKLAEEKISKKMNETRQNKLVKDYTEQLILDKETF